MPPPTPQRPNRTGEAGATDGLESSRAGKTVEAAETEERGNPPAPRAPEAARSATSPGALLGSPDPSQTAEDTGGSVVPSEAAGSQADPDARPRAPRPIGALSGPRRRWRFFVARVVHVVNAVLARTPLGAFLRRRLWRALEVRRTAIPLEGPRAGALGAGLDVAFLSDLHAGFYMTGPDLLELAERTRALQPDVICLGGDLVEQQPRDPAALEAFLRALRAPLGVFAVLGNHEYYPRGELESWSRLLERCGVRLLCNAGARVSTGSGSFWIAGVDDLTEGEPDLAAALSGRAPDEPALVLSHHPDLFVEAPAHDVDLQLSGHTHGGQVVLGDWEPLVHSHFGWTSGHAQSGTSHLYVGNGAGVTLAPIRIGAPPEIGLLRWG